jgi:hypothetical protein
MNLYELSKWVSEIREITGNGYVELMPSAYGGLLVRVAWMREDRIVCVTKGFTESQLADQMEDLDKYYLKRIADEVRQEISRISGQEEG